MNATVLLRLDIIKESSHAKYLLSNCLLSMYLHLLIQGSYYLYLLGQKSIVINGLKSFNMENCTFILESSLQRMGPSQPTPFQYRDPSSPFYFYSHLQQMAVIGVCIVQEELGNFSQQYNKIFGVSHKSCQTLL